MNGTDPTPNAPPRPPAPEPAGPDPLAFQRASLLMLVFRFRGKRSLVASRTLTSRDFVAELRAHASVLERHYPHRRVSAVEVVSYQYGRFYADPWPDGLRLLRDVAPHVVAGPENPDEPGASPAYAPEGTAADAPSE